MELGSSSSSSPSSSNGKNSVSAPDSSLNIGLKIGQKIYFKDASGSSAAAAAPQSPVKKGRSGGAVQGGQPPRCQVEGCNADLSDAKAYYSRHKVCGMHSKSPTVIVAGLEQRFCQQCSRFHQLPEFDQGKRSCRRRLAGHNERRRKPPPGTLLPTRYPAISSPLFDSSSKGSASFLMDFGSYQNPSGRDNSWSNTRAFGRAWDGSGQTDGPAFGRAWDGSGQTEPYTAPTNVPSSGECFAGVSSSSSTRALSLLSNQPWAGGSRNQPLGLGAPIDQFSHPPWGFKPGQATSSSSTEMLPNSGLGKISHPPDGHYSGELGMAQQTDTGREYVGLEQSRGYDSSIQNVHWTL